AAARGDERVEVLQDADHGPQGLDAAQDGEAARQDGRGAAQEHHAVLLDDVVDHLAHDRALPAAVGAVEEVSAPMARTHPSRIPRPGAREHARGMQFGKIVDTGSIFAYPSPTS